MEFNKNYNFIDDGTEHDNTDVDEGNIFEVDHLDHLALDISVPDATQFDCYTGDYGKNYKPSTSKISMISNSQTTENFLKEFGCFYTEMMSKVKGLKDAPALKNIIFPEDLIDVDEENLFKNLKDTPEVQEQLDNIKKLDDEIASIISVYKAEKEERLNTQFEMCSEIIKNNTLPEKDTELFLNLCHFEFSDVGDDKEKKEEPCHEKKETKKKLDKKPNEFIERNFYLAKKGIFANSSLTDQEKFKLEDLLQHDDECQNPKNLFALPSNENRFKNAYQVTVEDKQKIEEVESELEKFKLDEKKNEKDLNNKKEQNDIDIKKEIDKLNNFMLEHRLKTLEGKLNSLREVEETEKKDLEEKIRIREKEKTEDSDDGIIDIKELTMLKDNGSNEDIYKEHDEEQEDAEDEDADFKKICERIMNMDNNTEENSSDEDIFQYSKQIYINTGKDKAIENESVIGHNDNSTTEQYAG